MYQQAHPPDVGCDCVAVALFDLRLTSTMSSCLVEESVSIPGRAAAIFRNSACQGIDEDNSIGCTAMRFVVKQSEANLDPNLFLFLDPKVQKSM